MSGVIVTNPKVQFLGANGAPLVGGTLTTYLAGTTTPTATYQDEALTAANTNPVVLDARGECLLWLDSTKNYKFVLANSSGVVQWTVDDISGAEPADVLRDALAAANGASLIGYTGPAPTSAVTTVDQLAATGTNKGADLVGFLPAGTNAVPTTVQAKLRETVSVKDFGAVGDGVTDDTAAIQAAIDSLASTGGVVHFPPGEYRIARNIGVNDRWGIKVTASNITLKGDQATLRRFNTDISTYALAYPILFVGTPDSNVAAATQNIVVDGLKCQGENTQHSSSGSTLTDARYAIVFKNSSETWVKDCVFTAVDSSAILYQQPAAYDYANNAFFNTTKNYRSKITGCSFIATPHAVAGRALIHAIAVAGVDYLSIQGNYFEWCDDCVAGETTYNRYTDTENDTFTYTGAASALGSVKRSGRNITIDGNNVLNSSEHAFYPALMDVTINGNNIRTDNPAVCTGDQIKIRSRGATCTGNVISNYKRAIGVTEPSMDVTISGNVCQSIGTTDGGGVIDIDSFGLSSYISNRPFFYIGGSPDYQPMGGITVSGNSIEMPNTAAGNANQHVAFRISTELGLDANYPNGQIQGISITGNTVRGHNVGVYVVGSIFNTAIVSGNTFYAKAFTRTGFSAGTTLNTRAVLQALRGSSGTLLNSLEKLSFTGNFVDGSEYLFCTSDGAGSATTYRLPEGIVGNRLSYIKNIKTSDVIGISAFNRFAENTGVFFLDRTLQVNASNNSLGDGTTSNSALRYCFLFDGANLRYYTDDAGTYLTL